MSFYQLGKAKGPVAHATDPFFVSRQRLFRTITVRQLPDSNAQRPDDS